MIVKPVAMPLPCLGMIPAISPLLSQMSMACVLVNAKLGWLSRKVLTHIMRNEDRTTNVNFKTLRVFVPMSNGTVHLVGYPIESILPKLLSDTMRPCTTHLFNAADPLPHQSSVSWAIKSIKHVITSAWRSGSCADAPPKAAPLQCEGNELADMILNLSELKRIAVGRTEWRGAVNSVADPTFLLDKVRCARRSCGDDAHVTATTGGVGAIRQTRRRSGRR